MDRVNRLIQAVCDVQTVAGELIADAAREGDFHAAGQLAERGRELSELMQRWLGVNGNATTRNDAADSATEASHGERPANTPRAVRGLGQDALPEYPTFFQEADALVKLGWSQTARATYEHRAAKPVVDLIVKRLVAIGGSGHRFSMGKLLSAVARNGSRNSHPSYQVYAVVAWLKWSGLLIQHGRQGYTVANPKAFAESSATAWNALPRR